MADAPQLTLWLDLLVSHQDETRLIEQWFRVPPTLYRDLAQRLSDSDPLPLQQLGARTQSPEAAGFLRYLYGESGRFRSGAMSEAPDGGRLAGELQNLVAAAQAVHAAIHGGDAALRAAICLAADLTEQEAAEIGAVPPGLSPEERLHRCWQQIRPLHPGTRGAVQARTTALLRLWRGQQAESFDGAGQSADSLPTLPQITATRTAPVLIYQSNGKGEVGWLRADLLAEGGGDCYLDPETMVLAPMSPSFADGSQRAWHLAKQTAAALFGNAAEIGGRDICWRLESNQASAQTLLEGGSHGAALTVILTQLLADQPLDAGAAVTATVMENGDFGAVQGVREKARAAFALLDGRGYPVITRLAVHPDNVEEARAVARNAGRNPHELVTACRSLLEYLPDASSLVSQLRHLLYGEIRWILNDAGQRMRQDFTEAEQLRAFYVPVSVISRPLASDDAGGLPAHYAEGRRYPWTDIRQNLSCDLICGAPGHGKTMLLWQEVSERCQNALNAVQTQAETPQNVRFAAFLRAAELAEALAAAPTQPVLSTLTAVLTARHRLKETAGDFLLEKIKRGDCLIALDALDETPNERRVMLYAALEDFAAQCPQAQFVLTSRPEGALFAPLPVSREKCWEMMPFDDAQMEAALRAWFRSLPDVGANFWKRIASQRNLRHVLLSPLLLRIACSVALDSWNSNRVLPYWSRRIDLYETFLRDLTLAWTKRTPIPSTGQQTLFLAFAADVALQMLLPAAKQGSEVTRSAAEIVNEVQRNYPVMAGRALLDDLCSAGILIYAGNDPLHPVVTFTHRTFGEYLAASALARRIQERGWNAMEREIETYAADQASREIVVFLAGLLADPVPLLSFLSEPSRDDVFRHRLSLACDCLMEVARDKPAKGQTAAAVSR